MNEHNPIQPPRLAEWFLCRMSIYDIKYASIGDFEEEYHKIIQKQSLFRARLWYWSQVLSSIPAYYLILIYWRMMMFKNYLKITLRNINKHKGHSFLNILGLATGIACCIFILLYVQFELSYDRYHKDADRIFRVAKSNKTEAKHDLFASNVIEVAPTLKERFPEVTAAARAGGWDPVRVKVNDQTFLEETLLFADNEIFDIFKIPFIHGKPENALKQPGTMVLTQRVAERYFGNVNPIGRSLTIMDSEDTLHYEITGVVENCPGNTHLKYNLIGFLKIDENRPFQRPWQGWHGMNYIKLAQGVDPKSFEEKIHYLPHEYIGDKLKEEGTEFTLFLQSITSIHLYSHLNWELNPPGNPLYIFVFSAVGLFILLIACMNFINLTTARSANRSKEVGMRKVVGAQRHQLVGQFLGESILLSLIAFSFAMILVGVGLPYYNSLSGQQYTISCLVKPTMLLALGGLMLFIGIAGGVYPAFFLSKFKPSSVLRGVLRMGTKGAGLRKILVVAQFAISIILIIGTLLFTKQLHFMKNRYLGFDKKQKLVIEFNRSLVKSNTYEAVKAELLRNPSITGATFSSSVPGRWMYFWQMYPAGRQDTGTQMVHAFQVDHDFFPEYDIEIIAGRLFHKERRGGYIINESAMRAFGWNTPEEAITKSIIRESRPVLGVVKNFHFRGLQGPVEPVAIFQMSADFRYLTLKVDMDNIDESMTFIDKTYRELFPDTIYEYFFLDQDFDLQYRSEDRLSRIFTIFTFFGIFIACLGLFGLASFLAEQKTKEIGIRKVLGASVFKIVVMLSKVFVKWVLIANIIAWPVAWLGMKHWLQDFTYRIEFGILPFVLSTVIALLIAVISVSYQSIKAGRSNPVEALKYE